MSQALIAFLLGLVAVLSAVVYYQRKGQQLPRALSPEKYIRGLQALLRGDEERAFINLKETVAEDAENVDAYLHLGTIFRRRKKPEQALRIHKDLTFRGGLSDAQKREILVALYHDFMAVDDEVSARRALSEILAIRPQDRFSLEKLLRAAEIDGDWKKAAVLRKKLDKIDGLDSKILLSLYKVFEGDELASKGDLHRARLFYKEAIHLDKGCLCAYINVGDSYYDEGRLDDALQYWMKLIMIAPDRGQLVFERLKKGFFEVGRYGDYAEMLTTLLQSCPEHLTGRLELAYFLEKKGEVDAAREHYRTAIDHHPTSLLAKLGLYRLHHDAGRKDASDTLFKQIMKLTVKEEASTYVCGSCGLTVEAMSWRCPRCKAVNSFTPKTS